jgi:acetoin utilization deacetylase AcuC-like enzyme
MDTTGLILTGYHHDTGHHPERADRLRVIQETAEDPELSPFLSRLEPRPATLEELCAVHEEDYVRQVEEACNSGIHALDPDTMISTDSFEEARMAAGGVLTALDAVISGTVENAFCAVRPPGHHAEKDRAMGFCLFNNVAVAARYAQDHHGLPRVLIVDWDVHHGNGTQHAFYDDPTVFYFSIHQSPHYPGSGSVTETGEGAGKGKTLNVPLSAGSGDDEYLEAFEKLLLPAAKNFSPDLVLVSAGFDAHLDDPLAGMNVTDEGFSRMTEYVIRIASEHCDGRLVSTLEGGYSLVALQRSVRSHLMSLIHV